VALLWTAALGPPVSPFSRPVHFHSELSCFCSCPLGFHLEPDSQALASVSTCETSRLTLGNVAVGRGCGSDGSSTPLAGAESAAYQCHLCFRYCISAGGLKRHAKVSPPSQSKRPGQVEKDWLRKLVAAPVGFSDPPGAALRFCAGPTLELESSSFPGEIDLV